MADRPGILITDLDNTLYDFSSYYESGVAATIRSIRTRFRVDEDAAVSWLKQIYLRHDSIEYPFAIEELPPVRYLADDERRDFVADVLREFWTSATAALHLYPTVRTTLRRLSDDEIPVIAYTDAPIHEATRRLNQLGIMRYMTGIVARQWFRRRPVATFALYLHDLPGFRRPARRLQILWRMTDEHRKPSPAVYEQIAMALDTHPRRIIVVGDSIQRDLIPADHAGMRTLWAKYGKRELSHERLLPRVVPTRLPEVSGPVGRGPVLPGGPPVAIDLFEQVTEHLPVQQFLPFSC